MLLQIKLDEDKFYTKVAVFEEPYNFVADHLFIWNHLRHEIFILSFYNLKFNFKKFEYLSMQKQPKLKL